MKDDNSLQNKRIAKNTVFLYIRMLFTIIVSLFTSRVILQTLGVIDYGIYTVVGGIAALFSFITASMSQTIQRFVTFELGKGENGNVNKVFSIGMELQIIISVLIMLILEVIGLWMIENKLHIPADRMNAAYIVLQLTILTIPITLLSSPYNALIVAHEKMQAFAYISIFEVTAKLLIVYSLMLSSIDRLILYGFLYMIVMFGVRMSYVAYCKNTFPNIGFKYVVDLKVITDMLSFAGWNMYGALSYVGFTQGLNVLLNMFFLPTINAARGIAVQVQSAIYGFVQNFQMAVNPQITKTYANDDLTNMYNLIIRSAKFSLMLLAMISIPVIFEAPFLLKIWLKDVPEQTVIFVRIIVFASWITAIENPITYAVQASGHIRKYQLIVSSIRLCIVPVSYAFLYFGFPAFVVFVVHFCVDSFVLIIRLLLFNTILHFPVFHFIKHAILKNLFPIIISVIVIVPLCVYWEQCMWRVIVVTLSSIILNGVVSYICLLDKAEKRIVNNILSKITYKNANCDSLTIQS